jgi:hypothetical protein
MGKHVPLEVPVYPVTRRHEPTKRNLLSCARIDKVKVKVKQSRYRPVRG